MTSRDAVNYFSFLDDSDPEVSCTHRSESIASSGFETELDIEDDSLEASSDSTEQDMGRVLYQRACESLGVVPVKRFLDELRGNEVRVSHRNLGVNGSKAMASALVVNNTITNLDLSNNMIGDKGAMYIVSAIVEKDLVKVLVLARNNFTRRSAEVFAELIQRSKKLTVLNLSGNKFDDKDCTLLAEALKDNDVLEELDLSHNQLSEQAGVSLGQTLTINSKIQKLNLSWNLLRSNGAVAMAEGMTANQNLKILDLSWNGIDDVGATAFAKGLVTNSNLIEIQLSSNNISDKGLLEIVKVLEKCQLCSLNVSRNPFFGSNEAVELLFKLLLQQRICLKKVDIGQIPLTKDTLSLLAELKETRSDVIIHHGYRKEDSYEAMAPRDTNPCDILKDYAITHRLHSFQFFRSLGENARGVFRESIPCSEFETGLRKLNIFDNNQIHKVINILDYNRNDVIDYSEFVAIFSREEKKASRK